MFFYEAGGLFAQWLPSIPVAQATITLNLSGTALLVFFVFLGGYIGYQRGVRALITVALLSSLGYLWCVGGGDVVFGAINRLISIIPRFAGIIFSRDDWAATTWPSVVPTGVEALGWRIVLFLALVIISLVFNKAPRWYGKAPAPNEPWARLLGLYGGALIALLWTTAAGVFYRTAEIDGTFIGGILGDMLRAIPDLGTLTILVLMGVFFLILIAVLVLRLPLLLGVPVTVPKK